MDGREAAQQEFAAWLRGVRIRGGRQSLRDLEKRSEAYGVRVSRSTLGEMLSGKRFPTRDQAVAFARAASGNDPQEVAGTRKEWIKTAEVLDVAVPAAGSAHPAAADEATAVPAELPSADLASPIAPDATGPGEARRPTPRTFVLVSLTAACVGALVAGLVVTDPFHDHNDPPASAKGTHPVGAAQAESGTAGDSPAAVSKDPDAWTGRAPIAVQTSQIVSVCPVVWFDGTTQQYLAQVQPGGVPPRSAVDLSASIEVTVQGRTQQSVILQGMHINITAHHPKPGTGITVSSGQCGGGVTKRHFDVNLAATPPTLAAKPEVDDFTGKVVSPAVNFPYKISLNDPEVFDLSITKPCTDDCTYTVILDWVADGKKGTSVLDNHGHGFRSMNAATRPSYYLEPDASGMKLRPQSQAQAG
ncbi:hypothetical protein [Streptomyces sp. NRRL F-5122]|uniref:hypothetical protein n=1 Tax=Streptomyces sp. NRRL F-5122 TaxID=1609098 RepID=UPI00131C59C1|nr:hypothetical protein [Streptomyces sp. NRRL F-5122]